MDKWTQLQECIKSEVALGQAALKKAIKNRDYAEAHGYENQNSTLKFLLNEVMPSIK